MQTWQGVVFQGCAVQQSLLGCLQALGVQGAAGDLWCWWRIPVAQPECAQGVCALAWVQGQEGLSDLKTEINVSRNNQFRSDLLSESPSFSAME